MDCFDNRIEQELLLRLKTEGYRQLWIDEPKPAGAGSEARFRCDLHFSRRDRFLVFSPIMLRQGRLSEQLQACDHIALFSNLPKPTFPPPSYIPQEDAAWCVELAEACLAGLAKQGIDLLPADVELLKLDVVRSDRLVRLAKAQMEMLRPDLLFVPTEDGWYPRYYIEVARAMNVPVLLLQHGLDCEPYIYDASVCDYAALWSELRMSRYTQPPKNTYVTGNPQFDDFHMNDIQWNPLGDYVLLALRPNYPDKLHFPSRSPAVQEQLIDAVCDWLDRHGDIRLVIKMHPSSLADPVLRQVEERGVSGRCKVLVRDGHLPDLLSGASVVLTEDSSVCVDAMLQGKPLIFTHFMSCRPILPMVEYRAALDGFGRDRLLDALNKVVTGKVDADEMFAGQQRFLEAFSGTLDGNAGARFLGVLEGLCRG
jgi:hypothetical protein